LRLERTWKEASSDASVKVLFQPEFVPFADWGKPQTNHKQDRQYTCKYQRLGTANTLPNLLFMLFVIHVVLLLIVMFCVLFMCKCVLPPGVNPIVVDKYINISINKLAIWRVRVTILAVEKQ
jgi:hypothetical protein